MEVEDVDFDVDGHRASGVLTLPAESGRVPAVLTAPGFAGVKEMLIPGYSSDLAQRGVASLAFDYPGFGGSSGQPRQHIDPPQQLRTFRAAVEALVRHPRIDPHVLGVWGTSLSGGHALVMAASDPRIKAVAAVIPFIALSPTGSMRLATTVLRDQVARLLKRKRPMIPVAGHPGAFAVMTSDGAFEWVQGMAAQAPAYRNEVTVASLPNMLRWSTREQAQEIQVPVLCVLADQDTITPPRRVRSALAGVRDVEYMSFPQTHFELFTDHAEATRSLVVTWLAKQLRVTGSRDVTW